MKSFKVESSMITEFSYNKEKKELITHFTNNSVYLYYEVPVYVVNQLIEWESTDDSFGGLFYKLIVNQPYNFKRLYLKDQISD